MWAYWLRKNRDQDGNELLNEIANTYGKPEDIQKEYMGI